MAFVYSCCFWFSLRLGGILVGAFSIAQALIFLILCIIAYSHLSDIEYEVSYWISNMNLIYTKEHFEKFLQDPETVITASVILSCFYIIFCCMYIYGAYTFTNNLMYGYIILELIRLIVITLCTITWLLVLKRNTMDIGLLIGASIACGFLLLGMFYLWVCAVNLPILINEIELDEQTATIIKLQNLLKAQNPTRHQDNIDLGNEIFYKREPYIIARNVTHRYH